MVADAGRHDDDVERRCRPRTPGGPSKAADDEVPAALQRELGRGRPQDDRVGDVDQVEEAAEVGELGDRGAVALVVERVERAGAAAVLVRVQHGGREADALAVGHELVADHERERERAAEQRPQSALVGHDAGAEDRSKVPATMRTEVTSSSAATPRSATKTPEAHVGGELAEFVDVGAGHPHLLLGGGAADDGEQEGEGEVRRRRCMGLSKVESR
jgi:hypothetical protein